jgi:hypothetical protein
LFVHNLIISYYESNFYFISASIILQIINPSFSTVFNVFSIAIMPFYFNHLCLFYYRLYEKINTRRFAYNYKNTIDKFCILIEDIKYNLHGFDRFNYRRRPIKKEKTLLNNLLVVNYHLMSYIKKIILLLFVLLSHLASKTALSFGIILYLFQFYLSIRYRPFIFRWVGFLKSLTDFLDILMLTLMLVS